MDKSEVQALLAQPVAQVAEHLASLDRATLVEIQAQEIAGANRSTLLKAVDAALVVLDDDGESTPEEAGGKGAAPAPAAAKPAAKPEAPAWQAHDYAGPLSGEQAQWRVRNIKPARGGIGK